MAPDYALLVVPALAPFSTSTHPADLGAQPAPASTPRFYRPELDLLRLVAFAMVFAHHVLPRSPVLYPDLSPAAAAVCSALANAGGFGLALFFVLSGYLIATLLLREHRQTGTIRLAAFYARRALRIWPLYFFGIAIGAGWSMLVEGAGPTMFGPYLTFTGNWWFQTHGWGGNPMSLLWSISIEEQFYLVFPLLLLLAGVRRLPLIGAGLVVASVTSLVMRGAAHAAVDTTIWTATSSQAIFLGTGVLLAWRMEDRVVRLNSSSRALLGASAAALLYVASAATQAKFIGHATSGVSVATGYLLVALACAMIMVAVADLPRRIPAPLLGAGQLTFGLYVFHQLAMELARVVIGQVPLLVPIVALMIVVLLAKGSRAVIERPSAKWRSRLAVIPSGAPERAPPLRSLPAAADRPGLATI